MDKLENLVKGTKQELRLKNVFSGVMANELICKGCPHYYERDESFLTITLQVKNQRDILQSLESFISGEMLEGENAYLCDKCNTKVDTLKRMCIKKLPYNLMIVLKRFEFDFDNMVKLKINDYCEFPAVLNLEPYTQQYLRKKEKFKIEE